MAKKKNLSQEGRGYEVFQALNNLFFLLVLFVVRPQMTGKRDK